MSTYVDKFIDDNVNRYIQNVMPMRLLHLPEMKLMDRREIRQQVEPGIRARANSVYKECGRIDDATKATILRPLAYAILSHRWLDYEPDFSNISTGVIPPGPGLNKLKQFCHHAPTYKCEWAWSDTCCIDKSSSAEINESIRAMFRWYRQAEICLVYLGDTLNPGDVAKDQWFNRGWTLQELLAPKQIRFFNKNWALLGTRPGGNADGSETNKFSADFRRELSTITKIPVDDLESFTPKTRRAREVLFWASNRTTTREEDEAYSLLGILNVSIPIAYGEGARAFYRLQVEIANTCNEGNLFHWVGTPSEYNSAFAGGLSCFSFPEEDRPQILDPSISPIPRGSRLFTITNEGLRIKLPLYPVVSTNNQGPDSNSFVMKVDGLPDIQVKDELRLSARHPLMVAIIDVDHDDSAPQLGHSDSIMRHVKHYARGDLTEDVLTKTEKSLTRTRKNRFYTAILFEQCEDFSSDSFIRIRTSEAIRVRRPAGGWGHPVDACVR
jgi:hypothetical protein